MRTRSTRVGSGSVVFGFSLWLLFLGLLWSSLAAAVGLPSTYPGCASRAATVAWGGTVNVNLTTCHFFGLGVVSTAPTHGTATPGDPAPIDTYNYNHNSSTPAGGGTDTFVVLDDNSDFITVTVTIQAPTSPITVNPATLPAMSAGTPFSQTLTSTGGLGPYTYALQSGTLPLGLSLSSAGVLSGTPTQRGGYGFTVRSTDSTTPTAQFTDKGYSGTVNPAPLSITPTSATAIQSVAFSQTLTVNGGVAPHSCLLEPGPGFPAGISISSGCVISGTTAAATGNYPVTIRVTDSSTGVGTHFELESFTLTVSPPPSVSIAVAPASVSEDGATNLVYTVTRSLNLSSPTVVNITTGGTATSGTDYTGGVATVTIAASATTATITLDPTLDGTVEPDETATLTVAAGSGYTVGSPSSATGTILNDDVPTATIAVAPANVAEDGAPNLVYTITLNQANPSAATSVNFAIGGTATNGTDYATIASPLVISSGSTTGTITVNPTADATIETNETVSLTLSAGVGYTVGVPNAATGTILNDDLPNLTINDVTANEGNAGTTNFTFTVSLSAPAGPGGVTFDIANANGTATAAGSDYQNQVLTGQTIPAGSSTYSFTVLVNGDLLNESSETFFVNVTNVVNAIVVDGQGVGTITNDDVPVTVSPGTLPNGTVAAAYSQTITASGGAAPYTFAATAGALPAGLSLSPAGVLSGTATAGGTFNFTATATDSSPFPGPFSGSQAYTLVINPPTISLPATTLAGGTMGTGYSASITAASGGTSPYDYTVTAGALPGGLTLNSSSGAITGTPNALGTFNFTVTATDSSTGTGPYNASLAYSITVIDVPPTASNSALAVAYNAGATNVPLSLGGGAPTSLTITVLPSNGSTVVSGTTITYQPSPGYAGPDSFAYTATNSGGTSAPATVAITVQDPVFAITAGGALTATVATAYTQTFTFNGGAQPWSGYQVTNLPAGLSITGTTANTVTISGTPTQVGSFNLNVSGTDSSTGAGPFTVGQAFTLAVSPATLALAPPAGTLTAPYATAYSQAFTASGGVGPYTYAVSGALPAGLSHSNGTISGTPTAPGSFPITVTATDTGSTGTGAPFSIAQNYTIDVPAPTIVVAPVSLPTGMVGSSYSQTVSASGGAPTYIFTVSSGSLPAGLALSPSGTITGNPTTVGSFNLIITATDANSQAGSRPYTLTINAPGLALAPASGALTASYGTAFSQAFVASGGVGPYTYARSSGSFPPGLSLSGATLAGTPTTPGTYTFDLTATDTGSSGAGAPFTVTQSYSIVIAAPTLTLNPITLPNGTVGVAYTATFTASGGVAPYAYSVSAGALPGGLSLASNGSLTGSPTGTGSFTFTVRAADANGQAVTRNYTMSVFATLVLPPTTLANATAGVPYSATLTPAAGGLAPYAYAISGGALPAGLTLGATTGQLSGTPGAQGTFTFTVTATDAAVTKASRAKATVSQNYTLVVVGQAQVITFPTQTTTTRPFVLGGTFAISPLATGGGSGNPVTYSVAPAGVCTLSGTTITMTGPGTCQITASQAGSTLFAPATAVVQGVLLQGSLTPPPVTIPATSLGHLLLLALGFVLMGWIAIRPR